jgi:hypothetical protein
VKQIRRRDDHGYRNPPTDAQPVATWVLNDALPVAIFADAPPVTLADLLRQAYGDQASSITNVKLWYNNDKDLSDQNFLYWGNTADTTTVQLNGHNIAAGAPVSSSDFGNVTFHVGNNIMPNITVQVQIGDHVYQDLTVAIVPMNIGHPVNPGAPTPDDVVSAARQIDMMYGGIYNPNDCHWIAMDIAAAAGATLDPDTQSINPNENEEGGIGGGFWRVAYRGSDPGAISNWETLVKPGDIVRMGWSNSYAADPGGHRTTTVVAGLNADGVHPGQIEVVDNGDNGTIGDHWVNYDANTNPNTITIYRLAADHTYLIDGNRIGSGGIDETLLGTVWNDRIIDNGGADTLIGGAGDDTYYVTNANDKITENATDIVNGQTVFHVTNQPLFTSQGFPSSPSVGKGNDLDNKITVDDIFPVGFRPFGCSDTAATTH